MFLLTRAGLAAVAWAADAFLPAHPYMVSGDPGPWVRWDALWYLDLATRGYLDLQDGRSGFVFPPLYPLLVRGLAALVGSPLAAALLISNAALLGTLVLLARLLPDEESGVRAAWYLCLFPSAFVLSAPYTESLYLLLAVGAFAAAERRRWEWASAAALLASATRVVGVLLVPALLWLCWRDRDWRSAGLVLLAPLGLLSYVAWEWGATGDPTGFLAGQAGWGRGGGTLLTAVAGAWDAVLHGRYHPGQVVLDIPLNLLALVAGAAGSVAAWRRFGGPYGLYCLLAVLVPASTGSLMSLNRHLLAAFPLFMLLGVWGARPWVDRALTVGFSSFLAAMLAIWVGWYFIL